jgi:hypothetical protein
MKKLFLIVAAVLLSGSLLPAAAQSGDKCFKSDWLQQSHTVVFRVAGAKVTGAFTVSGDAGEKSYDFTGTRAGNTLTVKFTGGKMPDVSPAELKGGIWTLAKKGAEEILKIKVYGKNYETNKYQISFADYEPCTPGYVKLAAAAKPVSFAGGANSSKINLSFTGSDERKIFSLNARRGQALEIAAYGCSISVYLPDKKLYYEVENPGEADSGKTSAVLDVMSILSLPQTGNYLVMLKNAGGDPKASREVEFKIVH